MVISKLSTWPTDPSVKVNGSLQILSYKRFRHLPLGCRPDISYPLQTLFNPFPNKPWFLRVCNPSVLKTQWEKEKLLVTSNFSFFHSVFYPLGELSAIFIKFEILDCKHFEIGKV